MKVILTKPTYVAINGKTLLTDKPVDLTEAELSHPRIKKMLEVGELDPVIEDDSIVETVPLESMTVKELKDLAAQLDVELTTKDNTKAEIIAKIEAVQIK